MGISLYCTTQILHHITPELSKRQGEKQQQLSGKGTVILPGVKTSRLRWDRRSMVLVTVGDERLVWAWTRYGGKSNRTFAKNILVFVPLLETPQRRQTLPLHQRILWLATADLVWSCSQGNKDAFRYF